MRSDPPSTVIDRGVIDGLWYGYGYGGRWSSSCAVEETVTSSLALTVKSLCGPPLHLSFLDNITTSPRSPCCGMFPSVRETAVEQQHEALGSAHSCTMASAGTRCSRSSEPRHTTELTPSANNRASMGSATNTGAALHLLLWAVYESTKRASHCGKAVMLSSCTRDCQNWRVIEACPPAMLCP